jgi:hypothetical protein
LPAREPANERKLTNLLAHKPHSPSRCRTRQSPHRLARCDQIMISSGRHCRVIIETNRLQVKWFWRRRCHRPSLSRGKPVSRKTSSAPGRRATLPAFRLLQLNKPLCSPRITSVRTNQPREPLALGAAHIAADRDAVRDRILFVHSDGTARRRRRASRGAGLAAHYEMLFYVIFALTVSRSSYRLSW